MSTKGSFETMAEEKGVKQTPPPHKILNFRGCFYKNFENCRL
jgi:hypothetical protein